MTSDPAPRRDYDPGCAACVAGFELETAGARGLLAGAL